MVRNGCPGCTSRLRCLTVLTPQIKKKGRAPAGAPAADMFPVARRKPAAKGAAKPRSSASRVGSGVINRPTPMIRQPDDSSDTDREDVVDLDGFLRDLVAVVEESGAGVGQPEPAVAGQPSEAGRDVESLGELRVAIGAQGSEDESSDSSDGGHGLPPAAPSSTAAPAPPSPVAPPPPAPPPAPPAEKRARRKKTTKQQPLTKESRGIPFGPLEIARIFETFNAATGEMLHVGWGATCGQHKDRTNRRCCKKAIRITDEVSDETAERFMKIWLVEGQTIPEDSEFGRADHLAMNPRDLPFYTDAQLELLLPPC